MPVHERHAARGRRRGRRERIDIGQAFLLARRRAGITQRALAEAVAISQSQYGRVERGESEAGLELLCAIGDVLGLNVRVAVYPGGAPMRDAGHIRVLARLQALLPASFRWRTEVPLPFTGDLRAIDAMVAVPPIPAAFEIETRLLDTQSTTRRIMLKARDSGIHQVVLVLADTASNRAAVAAAAPALRADFPLSGRQVLSALRAGECPAGNGILFV